MTYPSQNFTQFEQYLIKGEPGIFVIVSEEHPHLQIQFPNSVFPTQYSAGGLAYWNNYLIQFTLCDWVTSFGAPNNNLPTPDQINAYLLGIFVAGPWEMSGGGVTSISNSVSGTGIVETPGAGAIVLKGFTSIGNTIAITSTASTINLEDISNPSVINYQVPKSGAPTTSNIYEISNSSGSGNITIDAGGDISMQALTLRLPTSLVNSATGSVLNYNTGSGLVSYSTPVNNTPILNQVASTVTVGSNNISEISNASGSGTVAIDAGGDILFTGTGIVGFPVTLPSLVTPNSLYYNTVNGRITYGTASSPSSIINNLIADSANPATFNLSKLANTNQTTANVAIDNLGDIVVESAAATAVTIQNGPVGSVNSIILNGASGTTTIQTPTLNFTNTTTLEAPSLSIVSTGNLYYLTWASASGLISPTLSPTQFGFTQFINANFTPSATVISFPDNGAFTSVSNGVACGWNSGILNTATGVITLPASPPAPRYRISANVIYSNSTASTATPDLITLSFNDSTAGKNIMEIVQQENTTVGSIAYQLVSGDLLLTGGHTYNFTFSYYLATGTKTVAGSPQTYFSMTRIS